jgi:hypothetical protein
MDHGQQVIATCDVCTKWLINWLKDTDIQEGHNYGSGVPLEIDSLGLLELLEVIATADSSVGAVNFTSFDEIANYLHISKWCAPK